jgi:hypothetical protein
MYSANDRIIDGRILSFSLTAPIQLRRRLSAYVRSMRLPKGEATVEQILFSFCDGQLYKIAVNYEQSALEGMTRADIVKSITAKYGMPTSVLADSDSASSGEYETKSKIIATWEDAISSFSLVRAAFANGFALVISSKALDARAEAAIADSVKLEEQERPQKEAEREKKVASALELARQKNKKVFQP